MMIKLSRSKIYLALILLFLLISVATLGYKWIVDLNWVDALYMAIITISTVGFKEVATLSQEARIFTIILITFSLVITAYIVSLVSEYVVSEYSYQKLKRRRVNHKIQKLTNHVIVCGYGRNGLQAVKRLRSYNMPCVVIDKDVELLEESEEEVLYVEGDAIDDEVLMKAGIKRASALICALPKDTDNLFVVLSARQLTKHLKIISRASQLSSYKKLKIAGADNVILPDSIGGQHMASLIVVPDLIDFMDNMTLSEGDTQNVQEIPYKTICEQDEQKKIRDLSIREETGCSIIGYKKPDGNFIINPESDLLLEKGSNLIILGSQTQMKRLNKKYKLT